MNILKTTLATVALVGGTSAMALDIDFKAVDADGNGAISMAEASSYPELMSQFKELDTDGNGELSEQEFAKAQ